MKRVFILVTVAALLAACANTLQGVGKDTETAGQAIQKKTEKKKD